MAGGAAGGFVTRAFDSMLKECSGKKYPELHKAINNYTGFLLNTENLDPYLFSFLSCCFDPH
jgi:hypothetical protein